MRSLIMNQFRQPKGWAGPLAALYLAHSPTIRRRNAWTVEQLDIKPDDRVLEIGCGAGLAIAEIASRLTSGKMVGVDHSDLMVAKARQRNAEAIAAGRVTLFNRSIEALPVIPGGYTKVLAVNVLQFLPEFASACASISAVMAPQGLLAVTYQPRLKNPARNAAAAFGDRLAIALGHAGFVDIHVRELPHTSLPVICVLARKA